MQKAEQRQSVGDSPGGLGGEGQRELEDETTAGEDEGGTSRRKESWRKILKEEVPEARKPCPYPYLDELASNCDLRSS